MTALLHRLLHDHPHDRRIQGPRPDRASPELFGLDTPFAATDERLVTRTELDKLRSSHPRRIFTGK